MSVYVWPVDNWQAGDGSKYTGRRLRQMFGALVAGVTPARPLGARSGVFAGTPTTTLSVVDSTWSVTPHAGVLDVMTSSIAGPYFYSIDDVETGTIPPADAAQTRIDLVSVGVSDPTEGDGSPAPLGRVVYTPGTPGSGTPATPAGCLRLGRITVPALTVGGSPTATWLAPFTVASGGILPCASSATYPAAPYVGMYVDDALYGLRRWDGSGWRRGAGSSLIARRDDGSPLNNIGSSTVKPALYDLYVPSRDLIGGAITFSGGIATVKVDGHYRWSASVEWPTGPSSSIVAALAVLNGTDIPWGRHEHALAGHRVTSTPGDKLPLSAGDTLQLGITSIDGTVNNVFVRSFSLEWVA